MWCQWAASVRGTVIVAGRSTRSLAVMTREEAITTFSALSGRSKFSILATIGFKLTIDGRATCGAGTEEVADPPQLRRLNESLHHVTNRVR